MIDEQADAIRRIVVGVDGSDSAARAVAWSARLVAGAEVVAVHAIGTPIFLDGYPFGAGWVPDDRWLVAWKEWRERIHEILEQQWCRALAQAGVGFRAETIEEGQGAHRAGGRRGCGCDRRWQARPEASPSSCWAASATISSITLPGRPWSCLQRRADSLAAAGWHQVGRHRQRRPNAPSCNQ